jgi:class 3 adenylate cyclase
VSEERQTTEDRARELLRDMLPKQVLEEFQQDKLKLAYRHDQITFLFADICGFTAYANSVDAIDVRFFFEKPKLNYYILLGVTNATTSFRFI